MGEGLFGQDLDPGLKAIEILSRIKKRPDFIAHDLKSLLGLVFSVKHDASELTAWDPKDPLSLRVTTGLVPQELKVTTWRTQYFRLLW
jgi:hypothetical protein